MSGPESTWVVDEDAEWAAAGPSDDWTPPDLEDLARLGRELRE